MCIVWSGGLLGDQLVASTNSGCLWQLKIQSSLLLHAINSAHTVDGLPIIVTRTALKGAGIPDAELVLLKTFPRHLQLLYKDMQLCAHVLDWKLEGCGWVVCIWWRIGHLSSVCSCHLTLWRPETPAAPVSLIWDEQWITAHECCVWSIWKAKWVDSRQFD